MTRRRFSSLREKQSGFSSFNNSPETKEYTYNKIGQVTSAKSVNANEQSVEENYSYDTFGRLISSISNDGSVQNYTYDANSNVETYELVEDDVVKNSIEYAYNTLNQMTTLTNNGIVTSYTYDANGNLTNKLLSTGVNTNYTYNKAGLMTYMESKKGSNVYTYSKCKYLLNGLVNRVDMQYDNNPAEGKIKYYNYDDAGRLIADNITNAAGFPVANSYEYDLYGNRVKMVSSPGDEEETETINYEYDLNNRLLNENSYVYNSYRNTDSYSSTHYYYDYNGNMTAKQKTYFGGSNNNNAVLSGRSTDTGLSVYRYDAFNRLANYNSGSNEASYTYNANNLRTSKTVNREKTNFVWNGQNLAAENKADITNTYTYDMTGVHIANQNGTVTSYLKDYHGNIAGKTTKTGSMFNEMGTTMDYDAFGNQWQGDVPDPFGYCGEYLDGESGLIYLRNRYYDSTTGRFITEDPAKDGLNWYNYCNENPVMMIDPNGLATVPESGVKAYNELIDSLIELIDCKINYINEDAKGNKKNLKLLNNYHKQAEHIRNDKVRLNSSLWYSKALNDVVNKVVLDNEKAGSIQEISSVIALVMDLRESIITSQDKVVGDEVMPENKIWDVYLKYRKSQHVYIPRTSNYPVCGDKLAKKILKQQKNVVENGKIRKYYGRCANGIYYTVLVPKGEVTTFFEQEDWWEEN